MALPLRPGWFSSRPLFLLAFIVPTIIFAAAAWYDYQAERADIRGTVLSTSAALAEHGQKVVETTDLVLARVLDHVQGMDWADIESSQELHDFIATLCAQVPQLASIFLVAPDGRTVASSREFPLRVLPDVNARDYIQHARAGQVGTYFSARYHSRTEGRVTFAATRVRLRNGAFDGIVAATISPAYLRDVYASVTEFPRHSTATLVRSDGTILFRYPELIPDRDRLPASSALYQAAAAMGDRGFYTGQSMIDGRTRMLSYRRLSNRSLFVSFSVDEVVFLRAWLTNMLFMATFCILLAAVLLLTDRVITRRTATELEASRALVAEVKRRQEAELALEQSQKMEALGRLTGGVAHDFNNLLTAIMGPLELAIKRSTDPRVLRLLSGAMQSAQRGASLTAQMLAVARKREVTVRPVDPNGAIREMGEMIARTIGPSIRVMYQLDPAATLVSVNLVQMEVTLLNLALNARDAMPGGGELTLRTERLEASRSPADLPVGDYIRISVIDTGEGMTEEVRARALEPFYTTKGPGKGTGLGLSTAYGFAHSAGGAVTIASMPGAGTTVSVILPRVAGEAPDAPTAPPLHATLHLRVLLVDDDDAVRRTVREMLEDLGHEVVDVAAGQQALASLEMDLAYDLLATDFAMPDMNGAMLAEAVRRLAPTMPILFITGYAKDDGLLEWDGRHARIMGKPFNANDLEEAVQSLVVERESLVQPAEPS